MTITRREFEELRREVARGRQELAQRPLFGGGGGSAAKPDLRIIIFDGNTLATGGLGIKFSSTTITDVPTAYDPSSPFSGITGVGRGQLFSDGVSQGNVLVINDGGGGSAIDFDVAGDSAPDVCSAVEAIATLTVGGDPLVTVSAYRIKSLVG